MGSKTTFSLLLHLIILSITLTDAQECYTTGNFTANSNYAKNRDLVLRSLASNVTANGGFYNTTIGSGNDTVYGLVHCMASSSAENCSSCVNYAIQGLMRACPYQKEALSWERNPLPCIFDQAWSAVRDIATRANSTRNMFAAETTDLSSTQTIYVYMQCTPDVSQSTCGECLQRSVDDYKSCCYSYQGGVVQKPNCFFRWDLYPYYSLFPQVTSPSPPASPSPPPPASPSPPPPASPSPPPPASPSPPFIDSSPPPTSITITKGKENTTSRTVIVTTVPTAILLALVILILAIFRFRKRKQEVQSKLLLIGSHILSSSGSLTRIKFTR
ncbi:CYSTEINE-RICH RECEPTOR-LIKE PROTEIN KINASE 34-RELATED [Salix purpurea]|uniref:CYSTEINE-RICH RECEPTOR-LIKE PROTEIN KINASE 34-RELATED n=1 Tax=Salix purpurea TaxID=77065 RepID=A0A9Q0WNI9_SALPP|nr:CYSTEINE-RICH RECEPTOR-LIKE PROTEIN KINASE 34-RELATED [Salix purpurea]